MLKIKSRENRISGTCCFGIGKIILKRILKKEDVAARTGFMWLSMLVRGALL
jgi:hypothetical protein